MDAASLKALACSQLLESLSRLMLAATRMDADEIDDVTQAVTRMAYSAEHAATYHEDED